jgi:type I restriction enzyme S subunit
VRNGSRDLIGKAALIDERAIGMTFGAFMGVFRSNCGHFLHHVFQSGIFKKQINEHLGATINQITNKSLNSFKVSLPPTNEERTKIAKALSDVDVLLAALDKVIAKKRDLKQAAMQQLLTGQTRLPGFSGDWEVTRLSALADIRSGGTPSTGEPSFWDGDIPWCTPTDITALSGYKHLGETARKITSLGLNASSAEMIPAKSVVMTSRATIGECSINLVPVSTNQGFKNFVPYAKTDVDFLYYLLGTQKKGFISLCGGSTFLEIGKTQLAAYEVWIPSAKAEQTAIAAVLSAMDEELSVLEQRRNKTADLKQGMLQELLTGRTRLV